MTKKDWLGIGYVSAWVVVWGTIASLIDYPLLQANIYTPNSVGQITTFALSALISILIGIWLFPKLIKSDSGQ